ncbi:hypothetical protein THRCLA_03642 [Thraustotheca clavata]|uniref:Uncharacterized protein n=1 Tax=Thraustotheca clavata TaxID=74557 RepID=A0A1W0A1F3_9STRA|nr:hypothetical protein THRCLA_03642 [Thraustotheca clavata]
MDDDEIRRQVAVALYRHNKVQVLTAKKQKLARRAALAQRNKERDRETRCAVEMGVEDVASRAVENYNLAQLRAEAERRKHEEELKLLLLVATTRKNAKAVGAILSTPGMHGKDRMETLRQRTIAIERDNELQRRRKSTTMHLEAIRIRSIIKDNNEVHVIECMERAIHDLQWNTIMHLVKTTPSLSIDFETSAGLTPLIMALWHNRPSIARQFLTEFHADANYITQNGLTPVLATILSNDIDGLRLLAVDFHANLHYESTTGVTPLLFAIELGRLELITFLIEHGVDCNQANSVGISPLIHAAFTQQVDVAEILVEIGAKLADRGKDGRTAQEWAQRCGFQIFDDRIQLLKFQRPNSKDQRDLARKQRYRIADESMYRGNIDKIITFVQKGDISSNYEGNAHLTPLLTACQVGFLHHVNQLLALGSVASQANKFGITPAMVASKRGHSDMLLALINAGASLAAVDNNGNDTFSYMKEFPDLVTHWTKHRHDFSSKLKLSMPKRLVEPPQFHLNKPPTEIQPESNDLTPTLPILNIEDVEQVHAIKQHKWQLQQHTLHQSPPRRRAFEFERFKVLNARQHQRRDAISVPVYEDEALKPLKRPLCGNCNLIRARSYCQECKFAYCDRCLTERHLDAHHHHHHTTILTDEHIKLLTPSKPSLEHDVQHISTNQTMDILANIRSIFNASCEPSEELSPNVDNEVKKQLLKQRRDEEKKRRAALLDINAPQLAAERAAALGTSIFTKPGEIRLARNYIQQKKFDKAATVLEETITMQEASFGAFHPLVGKSLYEMGQLYKAKEDWNLCIEKMLLALACFERHFAVDHKDILRVTDALIESWDKLFRYDLCKEFARVLYIQRKKELGESHDLTKDALELIDSYAVKWEIKLMFEEDPRGQRLVDLEINGKKYTDAGLGRLPEQFNQLLLSPASSTGMQKFTLYCDKRLHSSSLEFWLAVNKFKLMCKEEEDFKPFIVARDLVKEYLKNQRVKCATATIRNEIRKYLRCEKKETKPVDQIFDLVQDLVFQSMFTAVYLPFLDTPDGQSYIYFSIKIISFTTFRWHLEQHKELLQQKQ